MAKKKRYTPRYIVGLAMLPFLTIGYFFRKIFWNYLTKKKPFIEWAVMVLSIAIVVLVISGLLRGDFRPGKDSQDTQQSKKKGHR
ncbi:MAG TPA: hypothetical protein VK890_05450 [Bacteroidia bacterium]|jgi:hypothetical protein|nr:hypothetical protein [Bacteroidia bacterium]